VPFCAEVRETAPVVLALRSVLPRPRSTPIMGAWAKSPGLGAAVVLCCLGPGDRHRWRDIGWSWSHRGRKCPEQELACSCGLAEETFSIGKPTFEPISKALLVSASTAANRPASRWSQTRSRTPTRHDAEAPLTWRSHPFRLGRHPPAEAPPRARTTENDWPTLRIGLDRSPTRSERFEHQWTSSQDTTSIASCSVTARPRKVQVSRQRADE
jgi:hypothetical protein